MVNKKRRMIMRITKIVKVFFGKANKEKAVQFAAQVQGFIKTQVYRKTGEVVFSVCIQGGAI